MQWLQMRNKLLIEIARCPVVQHCIDKPTSDHPCFTIVHSQGSVSVDDHQVPEPWSGHINRAPILFVSSNPSISNKDIFPTGQWSDEDIVDFFNNRFGGGMQQWIRDGTKAIGEDSVHLHATKFWAGVKQRAIELLEQDIEPGIDYALTEIVHCKSEYEIGVRKAHFCVSRYLSRALSMSGASIVVVLGKRAREALKTEFGIPTDGTMHGPARVWGRERIITFLPHPNARRHRTFVKCVPENELRTIRAFLRRNM